MILVTRITIFFKVLRIFFPDIIQLDSSGKAILDNEVDEVSLLVDSRSPLCHYDYLVLAAAKSKSEYVVSSSICAIGKSIY